MTKSEIGRLFREYIRDFKIDPHDASVIYSDIGDEGLDAETLGDRLEMHGYPNLTEEVYELAKQETAA